VLGVIIKLLLWTTVLLIEAPMGEEDAEIMWVSFWYTKVGVVAERSNAQFDAVVYLIAT
jgi:hypothetical protein